TSMSGDFVEAGSTTRDTLSRSVSKPASLLSEPLDEPLPSRLGQMDDRLLTKERSALLIDGSHLFYAAAQLNIEVDYLRLRQALTQQRSLLRAYFYTGVDPQNDRQRGFLTWLSRNGYRVVSKALTQGPDGGRRANLQVEIAVDMLRLANYCHTLTLLSGDGALAYGAERLTRQGTRIEIVGLLSMTSDTLIGLADTYIDLADLQADIQKLPQKTSSKPTKSLKRR
ncbi:MAG: NYN domain-containing protein, partial [Cyanobacteria bacterium J06628_6]